MFAGDPGPQGLPGVTGPYTFTIPHRVQKRDAGNLSQMLHKKHPVLHTVHETHRYTIFFHPLQAIMRPVVIRGIAVKLSVAKGLTYYWIVSDFISVSLVFFFFKVFDCSNASSQNAPYCRHV